MNEDYLDHGTPEKRGFSVKDQLPAKRVNLSQFLGKAQRFCTSHLNYGGPQLFVIS